MAAFQWPTAPPKPKEPAFSLSKKERDGLCLGVPRHLCHLMTYHYVLAIPDTPLGQWYYSWTLEQNDTTLDFMLLNVDTFEQQWGEDKIREIHEELLLTGKPPAMWYLVTGVPGYDSKSDSWISKST